MDKLKIGDTIQCACDLDMIATHEELAKCGIWSDWLNIQEPPPRRFLLTITGIEEVEEDANT